MPDVDTHPTDTTKQAHARRHGDSQASVAVNVRDLYDQCVEAFEARKLALGATADDADHPSESYFYEQFVPAHALWSSSGRFTGRFGLVLRVIERTFRAAHLDDHYCAAQRRYLQHFAVEFRSLAIFASLDDKNNIVVGDPNRPVACIERGRRTLVQAGKAPDEGGAVQAMDHDAGSGVTKAAPTVTQLVDIPAEGVDGPWMRGDVFVQMKDAIHQPSSAARSVTEFYALLDDCRRGVYGSYLQEKVSFEGADSLKPILVGLTDGGSEHRTTFASVQLALAALFRTGDFDYVVFVRTCPHQSYMNFVERVMAILNIGCSGLAIMRDELVGEAADGKSFEKILKGCKSMKEVRKAGEKYPGFAAAVTKSMERVFDLLHERWGRLGLKGKPFRRGGVASEEDMDGMFAVMKQLDAEFDREGHTTRAALETLDGVKRFFEGHVEAGLWFMCVVVGVV